MNKQKSQDPETLRNVRIPVEPLIPECEVCEKQKANFYCTECKVHYCENCESQVHTSFWKRKHNGFIFQEPYIPQEKSEILQKENNLKFNKILQKWIKEAGCNLNLQRRFNSRTDGWKYQTFHEKCDNKGKSIVLIKLKNKSLFGVFAAIDWDSKSERKHSNGNKSFLFSLISLDPNFKEPLKMHVFRHQNCEICCDPDDVPVFGWGHDLHLGSGYYNQDMNEYNRSDLGFSYKPPFGYKYGSNEAKNFLAGSYRNWDIFQIEIFCEN
ncbi:pep-cterm sorting domain-containing protein [Anaeramoeba flamelloides]|uniref:Pep-cterm sorting domain-containing protein n=1 Tax=Anaeramoeba flamelloides TaxID=1746091 RepID=A0AAV7Z3K8_9EUKA|nr:pep-cterm sorting domain-containing protein [Anaeramoeba flamelloides]